MKHKNNDPIYEEDIPRIGGTGSASTLSEHDSLHCFWTFRSTSKAAALAYSKKTTKIGFHIPKKD